MKKVINRFGSTLSHFVDKRLYFYKQFLFTYENNIYYPKNGVKQQKTTNFQENGVKKLFRVT